MSESLFVKVASSANPRVRELLSRHPRVQAVETSSSPGVAFTQGTWDREVFIGQADIELYGLVEVMDNNPLVCADHASVPGPAATLALVGLAPLAQARLIADSPILMVNFSSDEKEVELALKRAGWNGGLTVHTEEMDLGGVIAASIMVSISTPDDLEDIDSLFDEQYGRSFYVHRDETSEWSPALVSGQAFASYRLRISADLPNSLLTIRLVSDVQGKCGASQVVHAMNVMCGFEESLGVS